MQLLLCQPVSYRSAVCSGDQSKDLAQIVLETVASLNAMQKKKERLIEITVDGEISGDELTDFVYIQQELEKISVAVETLQLWCEQMIDSGIIDREQYEKVKAASQGI